MLKAKPVILCFVLLSVCALSYFGNVDVGASPENWVYAGGTNPGVVYYYAGGTSWVPISSELGWSVNSIIYFEGTLFASAINSSSLLTSSGLVYRYNNVTGIWDLVGTLGNQVTFLIVFKGDLYAGTTEPARLYKYISATKSWTMVYERNNWNGFRSAYSWEDWLFLGERDFDRLGRWNGTTFDEFRPNTDGSCVYSMEVYGGYLYAGAYVGKIYRATYDPSTATQVWSEPGGRYAWGLKTFGGYLYLGFDSAGTGRATLYRYNGTTFSSAWNYTTTTTNSHEGIISMTSDDIYMYVGVGGEAVGYPLTMSAAGKGEIYRTSNGSSFELISGTLGTGVQTLYVGPSISLVPYDVTIDAYCNTEGKPVSVGITMDGSSTGFYTPRTFTTLVGAHDFSVPSTDANTHAFSQWNTGGTSTTMIAGSGGTYTAHYEELLTGARNQTYDSGPNNYVTDLSVANAFAAFDGDLSTRASFTYSSGTVGVVQRGFELHNFTAPVGPWASQGYAPLPRISQVDFHMWYSVSENSGARDDKYRIVYRVLPSTTPQVLVDWRNDYVTNLYVNGFDNTYTDWVREGASPYLGAVDYPADYVHLGLAPIDSMIIGNFDFQDLTGVYDGGKILLEVYARGDGDDRIGLSLFNGMSWTAASTVYPENGWSWQSVDVTSILDSTAKINGAKIIMTSQVTGAASNISVDAVRLTLYDEGFIGAIFFDGHALPGWDNEPEPNDGVWSWTDINNIRLTVETNKTGTSDDGCQFIISEAWVTVYSPPAELRVNPTELDTSSTPITSMILRPNGDAVAETWSIYPTSPATHFDKVDETSQNGDTDYVYATASLKRDSYNFEDPAGPPTWSIGAVRLVAFAKYAAVGPDEKLWGGLRFGAMVYISSGYTLTTSYQRYSWDWSKNPSTGNEWTWTDIRNLQAELRSVATGIWTGEVRVTQVYVEVIDRSLRADLWVTGVSDLWGCSLWMSYNTSVLTASAINSGGILNAALPSLVNDASGLISLGSTLPAGTLVGVFGQISLGQVYFSPDANGTSTLDLWNTKLVSPRAGSISHIVRGDSDVEVVSVTPQATIAYEGYPRNITVTIKNKAPTPQDITVTVYCNSSMLETKKVMNLAPGAFETINFTWIPVTLYGNYEITAVASTGSSAYEGYDESSLGGGSVLLTIPGDVNRDRIVDVFDILIIKWCRSGPPPGPGGYEYDIDVDINNDGTIDVFDILIAKKHLGESW